MRNPSAVGYTGGSRRMWGDFVGNSLLTDEELKRLASDLELGLIGFKQVRAARLEAEIGRNLDAARYGNYQTFLQNCSGQKNAEVSNQLHYEMNKSNINTCDGCSKLTSLYANDTIIEQICEDHTCPINAGNIRTERRKPVPDTWNAKVLPNLRETAAGYRRRTILQQRPVRKQVHSDGGTQQTMDGG